MDATCFLEVDGVSINVFRGLQCGENDFGHFWSLSRINYPSLSSYYGNPSYNNQHFVRREFAVLRSFRFK